MRIAVIVTTYNRPDALSAVLEGYLAQSDRNFELIVADDGSTEDTARVIRAYQERSPFAIVHVWQEDKGFRAAAARNLALSRTRADYVIFTDGDCIPLPDFVAAHRRLAETGWSPSVHRVLLSEAFTRRVLHEHLPVQSWTSGRWLRARVHHDINRLLPLLRLPAWHWLRRLRPRAWRGTRTCNLAVWRTDLVRVNGFDEAYAGWGMEDSDLAVRLLRCGVRHKSARCAAPLLHLWHHESDRGALSGNRQRLDAVLSTDSVRALHGLDQYAEDAAEQHYRSDA